MEATDTAIVRHFFVAFSATLGQPAPKHWETKTVQEIPIASASI